MKSALGEEASSLTPTVSGFVLSAAITILFNTALAWAKDSSPRLNGWMKSVSGHHWTTHGLIDLLLFLVFGFIFAKSNLAEKINPKRLSLVLVLAVVVASLGLVAWYVLI